MSRDNADDDIPTTLPSLDDNMVCKILGRVTVKSLMRFKCVCKSWQSFIESDPHFIDLQFTQSNTRRPVLLFSSNRLEKQGTSFFLADHLSEGSSNETREEAIHVTTTSWTQPMLKPVNGLICFIDVDEGAVLIYNLSTREATPWIKTTTVKKQEMGMYCPSYGFGFDPTTKEHKVLWVWERLTNKSLLGPSKYQVEIDQVCEVLTVGHNSWRRIHEVPPYSLWGTSFYANGSMYWLTEIGPPHDALDGALDEVLVVFDVGSEKFRVIPIPTFIFDRDRSPPPPAIKFLPHSVNDLLEVDGRIALIDRIIHDENNVTFKMWIFDDDDDDDDKKKKNTSRNWIEETISMSCEPQREWLNGFQAIVGTDLIIVESYSKLMDQVPFFYYYDRKKKTSRKVEINATTHSGGSPVIEPKKYSYDYKYLFKIATFVESLFPVQKQQQQQRHPLSLLSPRN